MELKPTLFIGSSREGLPVAELVKKHLTDTVDCKIWNEDVFEYGVSYLETLMEILNLFEYGVLVATADDFLVSRTKKSLTTRDNVLFEFGLFLGRLGRSKVFLLKEKGAKTPSDLLGISLPEFSALNAPDLEEQIRQRCERIKKQITDRAGIFEGGIFPSVPLAYGYFHNSLLPICQQLAENPVVKINGADVAITAFEINIFIPDDLRNDMKQKVEAVKIKDKWSQVEVPVSKTRSFNFYSKDVHFASENLVIMDIPTTLNALNQTIAEFVGSGVVGKSLKEKLVEQREIRYFKKVLDYLSSTNAFTKGKISTEIVDI